MEEIVKQLTDYTKELCGLDTYELKTYHLHHDVHSGYIFCSEWLPERAEKSESLDENPPGTACVEINFHTKALKNLIFVGGKSFAAEDVLPSFDKDDILDWLEEETGMMYGRQFQIAHEGTRDIHFRASIDHLPVAPSGTIDLEFNERGQLISFALDGVFPEEGDIDWEPFALTSEETAPLAEKLCTLVEVPVEKEVAWVPFYIIKPVYVTNDGISVIPEEAINPHPVYLPEDYILKWDEPGKHSLDKQKIDLDAKTSLELAMHDAPHPDKKPIDKELELTCIETARTAVQNFYPNASGQWRLVSLHREHGHIIAIIRPADHSKAVIHTLKVLMDRDGTFVNIVDNQFLFQLLGAFKDADQPVLSKEEAYEKLAAHITSEPVYTLNRQTGKYHVHAKIDCPYAVQAITGELVKTAEIL